MYCHVPESPVIGDGKFSKLHKRIDLCRHLTSLGVSRSTPRPRILDRVYLTRTCFLLLAGVRPCMRCSAVDCHGGHQHHRTGGAEVLLVQFESKLRGISPASIGLSNCSSC